MSFLHFDATTAASASQGIVHLQNINCDGSGNPWQASAIIEFRSDGEVWCDETGFESFLFNWIDPATAATLPGTTPYQIMRSNTVGDEPGGPNDGVWTELFEQNSNGIPVLLNGGTGYSTNDIVTIVGGEPGLGGFAGTMKVTSQIGGIVQATGLRLVGGDPGKYFKGPGHPASSSVVTYTGGSGSNLSSYASFQTPAAWSLSANYPGRESCDFTLSIRKGTGPVLATCSVFLNADAG